MDEYVRTGAGDRPRRSRACTSGRGTPRRCSPSCAGCGSGTPRRPRAQGALLRLRRQGRRGVGRAPGGAARADRPGARGGGGAGPRQARRGRARRARARRRGRGGVPGRRGRRRRGAAADRRAAAAAGVRRPTGRRSSTGTTCRRSSSTRSCAAPGAAVRYATAAWPTTCAGSPTSPSPGRASSSGRTTSTSTSTRRVVTLDGPPPRGGAGQGLPAGGLPVPPRLVPGDGPHRRPARAQGVHGRSTRGGHARGHLRARRLAALSPRPAPPAGEGRSPSGSAPPN